MLFSKTHSSNPMPILDKSRFLQFKNSTRFITASNLLSALSAVRNDMTSVAYGIKRVIEGLKI